MYIWKYETKLELSQCFPAEPQKKRSFKKIDRKKKWNEMELKYYSMAVGSGQKQLGFYERISFFTTFNLYQHLYRSQIFIWCILKLAWIGAVISF